MIAHTVTNGSGLLRNDIIARAQDSNKLNGLKLGQVRTQWLSVTVDSSVYDSSPAADPVTVTHPATGTYCVSSNDIVPASVSGNVQSQVDAFEDLTMIITSLYGTSACHSPNVVRIYTAKAGQLYNTPFTLTFSLN